MDLNPSTLAQILALSHHAIYCPLIFQKQPKYLINRRKNIQKSYKINSGRSTIELNGSSRKKWQRREREGTLRANNIKVFPEADVNEYVVKRV